MKASVKVWKITVTVFLAVLSFLLVMSGDVQAKSSTAAKGNLKLNQTGLTLVVGEKYRLKVIKSGIYSDLSYTWKSTKKSVATVSSNGTVKGIREGKATIKVTFSNGRKRTCNVTVLPEPDNINLGTYSLILNQKETFTIFCDIPEDEYTKYTYTSGNKRVATVDKNGVIKGVKPGSTKITVKTANGLKAVCKVTVCKGEVKYEDYDYTSYNKIVRIKAYKGKDEDVVIPKAMGGFKVRFIDDGAFMNNTTLKSVKIQSDSINIGIDCFKGCTNLKSINIDKVSYIGENAFEGCSSLDIIKLPNSEGIMRNGIFKNCRSLSNIEIPEGVNYISANAFEGCVNLTDIELPESVGLILEQAFFKCTHLKTVKLPENLTNMSAGAFMGCISLENITLPENMTTIEDDVFKGCSSLKSIDIPDGVYKLGSGVFKGCTSLESVTLPSRISAIGSSMFENCSFLKSIKIPENVNSIGDRAFMGCNTMKEIDVPKDVSSVGEYAFGYIKAGMKIPDFKLKCVSGTSAEKYAKNNGIEYEADNTIPVIEITGDKHEIELGVDELALKVAFYNMPDDFTYTWVSDDPEVATVTQDGVVTGNEFGITYIRVVTSNGYESEFMVSVIHSFGYKTNRDGTITITDYFGHYENLVVPSKIDGKTVTAIGEFAMVSSLEMKTVKIPSCVKRIKSSAFAECKNLKIITIPKTVESIGKYAFGYSVIDEGDDDAPDYYYERYNGIKIICYAGTAGEKYAKDNKFDYDLRTCITLDYKNVSIVTGSQYKLEATVVSSTPKGVTWRSSDSAIATVDQNGVVTAVSEGTCNIIATTSDGMKEICKVTVVQTGTV